MPKKDSKEAKFRNPPGNEQNLPPSFYAEVSGRGGSSKNNSGTSGGLGGTVTVGYSPNDKWDFSATGSGNFSFFLPNKELKRLGISSSNKGNINLDEVKALYNISDDTSISASYNLNRKGVMVRVNSKF